MATVQISAKDLKNLSNQEKLSVMTEELKRRNSEKGDNPETFEELRSWYPEMPAYNTIDRWTKEVYGLTAHSYLSMNNVLISSHKKYIKQLHEMDFRAAEKKALGSSERFYDRLFNIDIETLLSDCDAGTLEKQKYPDNPQSTVCIDDRSVVIQGRIGSNLKRNKNIGSSSDKYYNLAEAEKRLLSVEELRKKLWKIDQTSDGWRYVSPAVDITAAQPIEYSEYKRRLAFLNCIGFLICNEEIYKDIAKQMPKKKDGTFHKGRILRIASTAVVRSEGLFSDNKILEIVAKAETDDTIGLYANERGISEDEIASIYGDYVSTHWHQLGLDKYVSAESNDEETKTEEDLYSIYYEDEYFKIDGSDYVTIKQFNGRKEFLKEIKKYRSVWTDDKTFIVHCPYRTSFFLEEDDMRVCVDVASFYEGILNLWSSLLWFGGLYDYNSWISKCQEKWYKKPGIPFDCRLIGCKQYPLIDSIYLFARYVDEYLDLFDQLLVDIPRDENGKLIPGQTEAGMSDYEDGNFVFPPTVVPSVKVVVESNSLIRVILNSDNV